jgi:hypothetical protein
MAHVKSEGIADGQTADANGVGIDLEGDRLKGERRVTKHIWRIIPGDQSQDAAHIELPRHEGVLIQDLPPDRVAHESQDGLVTTLPEQDAAEPDGRASHDTGALVETIARFAMQASALTDQLSAMAAQLIQAERGQAKAERAGIMVLAKLKAAEARLMEQQAFMAEQEAQHQSELEALRHQHRAEIVDAEAAGEHYLAQLQAVRDRALAEIAGLKRQRDQASAALAAFRALPWWRRALSSQPRQRTPVRPSLNRHSPRTASSG